MFEGARPIATWPDHRSRVSLAFAAQTGTLYVADPDGIRRLDPGGTELQPVGAFSGRTRRLDVSSDGTLLGAACSSQAFVLDTEGNVLATADGAEAKTGFEGIIPLGPSRAILHTSSNSLAELRDGQIRHFERKAMESAVHHSVSPDHVWAVVVGAEAYTRIFHIEKGKQAKTLNEGMSGGCNVAFSPDSSLMLHARKKDHANSLVVRQLDKKWTEKQSIVLPYVGPRVGPRGIGFSNDGARVWCVEHNVEGAGRLSIWDLASSQRQAVVELPGGPDRFWPQHAAGDGTHMFLLMHSIVGQKLLAFDF